MIEGIQSYTSSSLFLLFFLLYVIVDNKTTIEGIRVKLATIFIFSTALRNEGKGTRFGGNLRLSLAFNLPLFLRTFYFFAPFPGQNAGKLNDYRNSINEAAEIKHGYG